MPGCGQRSERFGIRESIRKLSSPDPENGAGKSAPPLGAIMTAQQFYLGGGTALAIHLGHRRSVDFDWFTRERIADPLQLARDLNDQDIAFVTGNIERGTLHGSVSGVQVSFLEYRYPLLQPLVAWPMFGCMLASRRPRLYETVSSGTTGAKKDFCRRFMRWG